MRQGTLKHETPETSPLLPPGSDTTSENPEEKLLVPSFCSPSLPWLLLAAEDPVETISSTFGALLCCWVLCLGEALHSPENSRTAWSGSEQGSGAWSRGDPLLCHSGS